MKISKILLISVLTIAMPISQARAVIPDSNSVISDVVESSGTDLHISGADSHHANLFQGITLPQGLVKPNPVTPSSIISQTPGIEELETQDQTEDQLTGLVLPGHHFWTTRKLVITTSVLLTASLLVGLLLLLASGGSSSGEGSATGGGSGGGTTSNLFDNPLPLNNINGGNPPNILDNPGGGPPGNDPKNDLPTPDNQDPNPPSDDPGPNIIPLGGGGPFPDGGDNPPNSELPTLPGSGIPHHPEPSTFLLMGLGLLIPFLRKRSL